LTSGRPLHQFASAAIHISFGFISASDIAGSAVKAIGVYESIGFMHVSTCSKALQGHDRLLIRLNR
jgi:hypothetical protein